MTHSTKAPSHVINHIALLISCIHFDCLVKLHISIHEISFPDTNQLAGYTKMYEPIHAELSNMMRAVPDQLRSLSDATVNMCTQRVSSEINKDIKTMQVNLLKTLKDNIKMEVRSKLLGFNSNRAGKLTFKMILRIPDQTRFRNAGS